MLRKKVFRHPSLPLYEMIRQCGDIVMAVKLNDEEGQSSVKEKCQEGELRLLVASMNSDYYFSDPLAQALVSKQSR